VKDDDLDDDGSEYYDDWDPDDCDDEFQYRQAENVLPATDEVEGQIVRVKPWGAFVRLNGTNQKAFLHVTEMGETITADTLNHFPVGTHVKGIVMKGEVGQRGKMWITLKTRQDLKYRMGLQMFADYVDHFHGKVLAVFWNGAFIDAGARNAVYMKATDIIWGWKRGDLTKELKVGDNLSHCGVFRIDFQKQTIRGFATKDSILYRNGKSLGPAKKLVKKQRYKPIKGRKNIKKERLHIGVYS
jgi:ribosomal protein S1